MEYNLASIWTGMMAQSRKLSPCLPLLHGKILTKTSILLAHYVLVSSACHQCRIEISVDPMELTKNNLPLKAKKFSKRAIW